MENISAHFLKAYSYLDQRSSISSSRQKAVEPSMRRRRSFKNGGVLIICRVLLASTEQLGGDWTAVKE